MKKYIRIIIPVLIFVAVAAFILYLPDISEKDYEQNQMYSCGKGKHSYTVDNICAVCDDVLKYTEGLKISIYDGYCIVDGGDVSVENLVIPYGYNGVPVMYIGAEAFQNNKNIKSVTLPEGIKNIGRASFYNCPNLEKVNIPSSVIGIGSRAFLMCSKLSKAQFAVTEGWWCSNGGRGSGIGSTKDERAAAKCLRETITGQYYIYNVSFQKISPICESGKHMYNYNNYCDICNEKLAYM